jgi:hypothetical protein
LSSRLRAPADRLCHAGRQSRAATGQRDVEDTWPQPTTIVKHRTAASRAGIAPHG